MKNRIYLDIHVLQTVPPSCVNRDDTGSPKTAIYGGTMRARVSSQAWKRAMRKMFSEEIFPAEKLGFRTRHIVKMLVKEIKKLEVEKGRPPVIAADLCAKQLLDEFIKDEDEKKKRKTETDSKNNEMSKALMFFSHAQAVALANLAFDERLTMKENDSKPQKGKSNEASAFQDECKKARRENPSIDIALFGRMVASDQEMNCDAAAQVAHSISTHTIQNEYDYFTAVDDLSPEDTAGAGHLGTIEFNSSTLYRYATLNLTELEESLGKADTPEAARGFVEAFIRSMPTGKQNTFANRTLPSMVYVTIRKDQPVNLCGAFEKPVYTSEGGYAKESEQRLVAYAKDVYEKFVTEPVDAFGIGDEIAQISETMPLNVLLDRVFEKTTEYLAESEGA